MDPLARLTRTDKWFLGGGKGAIYAPPFPKHLLAPGFWDECYFADIRIPRLFTILILRDDGRPVRLRGEVVDWRPDRLRLRHVGDGVEILEDRVVTESNAWTSTLRRETAERWHVFLWSLHDIRPAGQGAPWFATTNVEVRGKGVAAQFESAWPRELEPDRTAVEAERVDATGDMLPSLPIYLHYGANRLRESWTINLAQRHDESPLYELSVLPEKFHRGSLPHDFKRDVGAPPVEGLLHAVQHYVWDDTRPLTLACGAGLTSEQAYQALASTREEDPAVRSESAWRRYFASVPQFESSDPYLTNAYWYRWYGLRLNTVDLPGLPISGRRESFQPFVTEGVGFFRNFVTYSAQAHLREVAWMRDPSLAVGILDNLVAVQREDGSFPGHNYSGRPARDFYHADFATGIRQLHALHPGSVNRDHLAAMRRYADYFLRHRTLSRDPAGPTLYDVFDQNETGQEYMSRYQFASEDADKWASFRVSGVDATVYAYQLFRMLAEFRAADSPYRAYAEGALAGLRQLSWDESASYFCDVRPDGTRSPARPATGLYSLLVEDDPNIKNLVARWRDEFWLPAGFPATAASDPTFSAEGEWKGKRLNCPWNGRSWPMANSHLVDGFAHYARTVDPSAREMAGEALLKAVRLMFHDGDPARPNAYEHYDPITGVPALYRGYDDYMHSWIVDLILRHAVGVLPGQAERDPLPLPGVEWVRCEGLPPSS